MDLSTAAVSSGPFRVVGIGASAGGLESLELLFAALPAEPGMAFVVVQHLSPDFRSMMDELLARHSSMPIHLARHEMRVEPNHVYLLPPGKEMIIRDRRLLLTDKDREQTLTLPIDQFFRSLAHDCGAAAIGVVLSGSGSDGSRGLRDIHDAGGLVFVETPQSAQFDGMPVSAIATGVVNQIASPAEIATLLVAAREVPAQPAPADPAHEDPPLAAILDMLRQQFGLDFSQYKTTTVSRRVLRRVELGDTPSLEAYVDRLRADPVELGRLYQDLLIGVTRFFRDPRAFEVLERTVVPELIERTPPADDVRVWVAGCATGEEAYSIAMILLEQLAAAGRAPNLKVLATDVHRESLAHASAGVYDEEQLEHVSPSRRDRFFTTRGRQFVVATDLRQHVVFAHHNVTRDAPFTKMQLITCRNLLIYLEPHAQKMVLSLFHFGLATGGVLFLGSSETPGELTQEFSAIDEHWRIYRKRRDVRLIQPDRLAPPRRAAVPAVALSPLLAVRPQSAEGHLLGVYDQLLDRHMPPAFLIDEERSLVDCFGGAERYLHMRPRRPSVNVLDLLAGDLRTVVAGAVQRTLNRLERVRYEGVPVPAAEASERVAVSAETLTNSRTQTRFVLVTLEPDPRPAAAGAETMAATTAPAPELASDQLATLEADLLQTRERLQATVEELQTSNEELQATNEELVASNEELQSTNEELHSVNEELYTVNAEHQRKIVELRVLNSDMQHLLESTDVGMLFLDRELCIRRYTPRVASIFHLEPGDIGRSIRHFSHTLAHPRLLEEIERALAEGTSLEEEVSAVDGTPYFLRILPYQPFRSTDGDGLERGGSVGEGVVVSLTDISSLARAQERIRHLSLIVDSSEDAIIGKTLDGTITAWNPGAERLYGYTAAEAIGRHVRMLAPPGREADVEMVLAELAAGRPVEHLDTLRRAKDGRLLEISASISPLRDRSGQVVGAASIARDVTPLRQAQREVAAREAHIRLLLDSTAESIYGVDVGGAVTFCNSACVRALGYDSVETLLHRPVDEVIRHVATHGDAGAAAHPARGVLQTGERMHAADGGILRADGSTVPVEYWSYPIRDDGRVIGAVVTFIDITERKKAEAEIREAARRREQFLAMLSHELRNPLAAIVSATQVLRRPSVPPAIVAHTRDVIARQSAHMRRLLDDLLDVARITRGGIGLRKTDVDLRAVVRLALEAASPLLRERHIGLTVNLPEAPLPVRGDEARLQQVIGNLLSNAARYSDVGSAVRLSARDEAGEIVLRVKDEGRGIDPSMLPAIFDLFVQGEQGLDRRVGGLGIGLTLVRQIVTLHGGRVEAHSDGRDRGSEFIVRLPRQEHAIVGERRAESRPPDVPARRVVLAEDQADARSMVRVLLEQCGHVVLEAADGASALAAVERSHPDVALIDIGLPHLNGYDLARRVRQNPQLDDVVLVALTGYGTSADVDEARAAGFDEHITKPCDLDRLNQVLRQRRTAETA